MSSSRVGESNMENAWLFAIMLGSVCLLVGLAISDLLYDMSKEKEG